MKTASIPLHKIRLSTFNPPTRTTAAALKSLESNIAVHGVLSPVHVIPDSSGVYVLVDGHRRVCCAMELGLRAIDAVVHDVSESPVELWATLNSKTRTVSAYEWMVAWHLSKREMSLPPGVKSAIDRCIRIFGENGISFLIEHQTSPGVRKSIDTLYPALERADLNEGITRRQVAEWIVRHHLPSKVDNLLHVSPGKRTLKKIRTRIMRDEPFSVPELAIEKKRETTAA